MAKYNNVESLFTVANQIQGHYIVKYKLQDMIPVVPVPSLSYKATLHDFETTSDTKTCNHYYDLRLF